MRNLVDTYAKAWGTWAGNLSTNALSRTISALDKARGGCYEFKDLSRDVNAFWRDVADFRAPAALGWIPTASLVISSWNGAEQSNFVQAPQIDADTPFTLKLTPVVNPKTGTALTGLALTPFDGESSVQVTWQKDLAGPRPTGDDAQGLFQGAIYQEGGKGEMIAAVYVRTNLK